MEAGCCALLHRITLCWSVQSTEPTDTDQDRETEVRGLERNLNPDDAVAEVLAELVNNLPKKKSEWKWKCLPT